MSQETLQYLRIPRMSNPHIICGIVKGIHGILKGYLQICLRASAQSESSEASAESCEMITVESSYCIPRIVEG